MIILLAQIPILLCSIIFNRSKVQFFFTNFIWMSNICFVIGLGYVAYVQAQFDQSTKDYCQNFDIDKPENTKSFIFNNLVSKDL